MAYAKIEGGSVVQYPYTLEELFAANPFTAFPKIPSKASLEDHGVVEVATVQPPSVTAEQSADQAAPVKEGSVWMQSWVVRNKSAQELAVAKLAKWEAVKTLRDQHIDGGCFILGTGTFDSDPISRSNITGAALGASISASQEQEFSISWKLADNSIKTLNGAQMIAVGMGVLTHVATCHAVAQQFGLAIDAATTFTALNAIDLDTGWPA